MVVGMKENTEMTRSMVTVSTHGPTTVNIKVGGTEASSMASVCTLYLGRR